AGRAWRVIGGGDQQDERAAGEREASEGVEVEDEGGEEGRETHRGEARKKRNKFSGGGGVHLDLSCGENTRSREKLQRSGVWGRQRKRPVILSGAKNPKE